MAVRYSISDRLLTIELAGAYEPEEIVRTFREAMNDPACPKPVALLVDVSRSQVLATRPAADIRKVAGFLAPFAERIGGRVAVVAPEDVHFGLSRIGAVHLESLGICAHVVRTPAEALGWLAEGD